MLCKLGCRLLKLYSKSTINKPSSQDLLPAYIERSSLWISYQQRRSIESLMVLEMDFHSRGSKAETTGNAFDLGPSYTIPDSSYPRLLFDSDKGLQLHDTEASIRFTPFRIPSRVTAPIRYDPALVGGRKLLKIYIFSNQYVF